MKPDPLLDISGDIFQQFFDQAPIAIQVFTPDGTLQRVNRSWEALWQTSPEKARGYNLFQDPQLRDSGAPAFRRALAGENVLLADQLYDPALSGLPGRKRWLRTRLFPTRDQAGVIAWVVVLHTDISEEKFASQKFQQMIDQAQEAVSVVQDGELKFGNRRLFELTDYSTQELRDHSFLDFVHPEDRAAVRARHEARLRGEGVHSSFQCRVFARDGRILWVEGSSSLIDWEGQPAILSFFNDVSQRVQAERTLAESEERFRLIAERSLDMIHLNDQDGRIVFANPATERLLGWPLDQVIGRPAFELIHPEDREEIRTDMGGIIAGNMPPPRAIRLLTKDGSLLPVDVRGFSFTGADGRLYLGAVLHDISERLEKERALTEKLDALGLLAGGIAHDFNNLLMAVTGNLSLLRTALESGRRPPLASINDMEKACERATGLTRQLLTFARGGTPVKRTADISEILEESATFVLHGSSSRCRFDLAADLWTAEVDPGQIGQVVQNIVLNAAHAMPGGGTVCVGAANRTLAEGEVDGLSPGPYLEITIEDHGTGIPREHLANIFVPYFSTKKRGSGIGLAAAHSIVRKHGGQISVDSELDRGTVFTLLLPADPGGKPARTATEAQATRGKGKILLLDDEEMIRKVATAMLETLGYQVEATDEGNLAVALFRKAFADGQPSDGVILDLTIPGGMGGVEAAGQILAIDPQAVLIASSGYADDDALARFAEHGFGAILPKPYQLETLAKTLAGVIRPA